MNNTPRKQSVLLAGAVVVALAASVNLAQADWPNENPTKWVQMPDLEFGMNVKATAPKILADDFQCRFSGPITDIHIWGSWLFDEVDAGARFKLSIHKDVPAGADPTVPWSHPGEQLWSTIMLPGQYVAKPWATTPQEPFFDPNINQIIGFDNTVWQYNFYIPPTEAFVQQEGNIYWLDVQAFTQTPSMLFGWKTSRDHWNDDATWGDAPFGGVPEFWRELIDPRTGQSLDLAFALTTIPEPGVGAVVLVGLGIFLMMRRRA